ncbi:MAG: hydrogenase iron-sulfur subunit [candidate division NC10 bacterium]|nr:hydrogenase iron-sulfur subunit [candidate division NC10 bacterium]
MCSGRVDPTIILEAFLSKADGVFVGACRRGECHYVTGNLQAEGKVNLTKKVLSYIGLHPERLVMEWMSSGEGGRFVECVTSFQEEIRKLGPLGKGEGIGTEELQLKLTAAQRVMEGKKLRWVVSKRLEFKEKGNLYGEVFTEHEISRLFDEVVMDELTLQEILLRLRMEPLSAKTLSGMINIAPSRILRHLADMKRMGLVSVSTEDDGRSPVWKAV